MFGQHSIRQNHSSSWLRWDSLDAATDKKSFLVELTAKNSWFRVVVVASVTKFGEISPLWQRFTSLWQIFDNSFLIWQNTQLTLADL